MIECGDRKMAKIRFSPLPLLFILIFASVAATAAFAEPSPAAPRNSPTASSSAASPAPPSGAVSPAAQSAGQSYAVHDAHTAVISYLSDVIGWRRRLADEIRAARDPVEILFVSDDRQMADEVVKLAFAYAHAEAALLKSIYGPENGASATAQVSPGTSSSLRALLDRRDQIVASLAAAKIRLAALQHRMRNAARAARAALQQKIVTAQGEIALSQSQLDSVTALIAFESGSGPASGAAFDAQIDELERNVPQFASAKPAAPASVANSQSAAMLGFFGGFGELLRLTRKDQMLDAQVKATAKLAEEVESRRAPLLKMLQDVVNQGQIAAAQTRSNDIATLNASKRAFDELTTRQKLISDALVPLSKQQMTLNLYLSNLNRWIGFVSARFKQEVRSLILRTAGFAVLFGFIFGAAALWRVLTFRYIGDHQRRHQLMKLRRLILTIVIVMIILLDFANELGALATIMGFAAAGIALALQNVFVSVAGYFYASGRFGIRIGDRIQLAGVTGDVVELSLFKLTMMELSANSDALQPTGRVVVFANSVLFQGNANFFKPLPGARYEWNELRLTLAPDCDWRLAEKRVDEVVGEVFARFRDAIERDYRHVETSLNVRFETPRPRTRLHFGANGLEIVLRYPAPIARAMESADELTRRLLDALAREPALKLVATSTPALQRAPEAPPPAPDGAPAAATPAATEPRSRLNQ